ncbi:MAG: hypothetical protein JNK04_23605 [Myxococcales bacterium]|nr:hypothetical protein [Myxococcales bacterium]
MEAEAVARPGLRGFLHRPTFDLLIQLGPWFLFAVLLGAGYVDWQNNNSAVWVSQFVLGNTTHVILTFLVLAFRRDVLFAAPGQARTVVVGSLVTFVLAIVIVETVVTYAPFWGGFPLAVIGIFGTHHRLSQAKGIWSLYNLRAAGLGMPPPSSLERTLQQNWTPVGLVAVMTAWLFTPSAPERSFPFLQAIPNEPAFLPYAASYALAIVWTLFGLATLRSIGRGQPRNWPKTLHVASHVAAVTLAILAPPWGAIVWGSIHGLEYYFLCARMMRAREGDSFAGPGSWLGHPAFITALVIVSMLPLFWIGLGRAPFSIEFGSRSGANSAVVVANALVVAHYFADAFIYRFRIPSVRKVMLARLGF